MATLGKTGCASALRPDGEWELERLGGQTRFRGKRFLDIGTGDGRLAMAAALYAEHVVAIDPDADAIGRARVEARHRGLHNVTFRVGGAQELRLGTHLFDVAAFSWSL